MDNKIVRLVLGIGLLTSVCLAGSVYLVFSIIIPWIQRSRILPFPDLFGLLTTLVIVLGTGAFWGYGIGWLMKVDAKSTAVTGAKNWFGSFMVFAILLEIIMVPLILFSENKSINLHILFTIAFVVSVGVVAAWNSYKITARIGFENIKKVVGRNSGLAAGIGFMAASLALQLIFRWEVGSPVYGKYNMITITHICNIVAGLAGGSAMGWTLGRWQAESQALRSDQNA